MFLLSPLASLSLFSIRCCDEPYPHVTYTIHIRRKTLFYFNNLIVPCFLITALGLLTFVLPPNTGERVTLVITTLLAMTVFMLMIAEKTPTTSKVTPLIGKFFIASMVIIGLSLIATCVVLNLYECTRAVESVPKPIRVIILEYLAPLLRVDPPIQKRHVYSSSCSSANQYAVDTVSTTVGTAVVASTEGMVTGATNWNFHEPNFFKNNNNNNNDRQSMRGGGGSNDCNQRKETEVLPKEISEGIAVLSERAKQQEKFDELTEEWQAVAKVADRFFLIVFLFTIAAATTYLFVNRPNPDDL